MLTVPLPYYDEFGSHAWHVVRTSPKREHIATAFLRTQANLEVLCPRIVFHRRLKRGKVKFVEALFPCYIFVFCDINEMFRRILSTEGVQSVLRYGSHVPKVPSKLITELVDNIEGEMLDLTQQLEFEAGSEVEVVDGPFCNMTAIVKAYDRPAERVRLLLDLLGRTVDVTLPTSQLLSKEERRGEGIRQRSLFGRSSARS